MRTKRICIYGGTDLTQAEAEFVEELSYQILKQLDAVIVTGGVKVNYKVPQGTVPADLAALNGARRFALERSEPVPTFFQAWIPDPGKKTRSSIERMTADDIGGEPVEMRERSALGRRLAMVREVDLVVTISGKKHTETVLEQALEIGRPALPLPFTGGDSADFWGSEFPTITKWFPALSADDFDSFRELQWHDVGSREAIVNRVIQILGSARLDKCLVLMPYDSGQDKIYATVIQPAIEEHMEPVRLDASHNSDEIRQNFSSALDGCRDIIADVTDGNVSVCYELGWAHALGRLPLMFSLRPLEAIKLPVYLTSRNIVVVKDLADLPAIITARLADTVTAKSKSD